MKVGLLVECGRKGLEAIVCRKICDLLRENHGADIAIDIVPMDNKRRLIEESGDAARALLQSGFERVVILWDERPAWPKTGDKLCWHNDRVDVLTSLNAHKVDLTKVGLVCIEREFESWLLYDHSMLSELLSRPAHKVNVPKQNRPDRNLDPTGTMTSLMRQLAGVTYVDVQLAPQFARHLVSLNKLKKCPTFKRFAMKVANVDF
jgi:hypothetical protein